MQILKILFLKRFTIYYSTWIVAALRNEQFFSLYELNAAIKEKLKEFNGGIFQKKGGSRRSLFLEEEFPLLMPLPDAPYELATWKKATVQFNYHISVYGMLYSAPYEHIKRKVDARITERMIEVFLNHSRICSHRRLYGRKGQYSTMIEHMPKDHQQYLEWNGDRFRKWAKSIGPSTHQVTDVILLSSRVEQQSYRSCMRVLKLADKYSKGKLEAACGKALSYTSSPSFKSVKSIIKSIKDETSSEEQESTETNQFGITRGADYYRRKGQ